MPRTFYLGALAGLLLFAPLASIESTPVTRVAAVRSPPAAPLGHLAIAVPPTTTPPAPEPTRQPPPAERAPARRVAAPAPSRPVSARSGGGCVAPGPPPPAYIRARESGGDYGAVNASSGAGGAWQMLPSTFRSVGGRGLPQNASPAEQDCRAAMLWDNGRGASHWAATR